MLEAENRTYSINSVAPIVFQNILSILLFFFPKLVCIIAPHGMLFLIRVMSTEKKKNK